MKAVAKARFSQVVDIVEDRQFLLNVKSLVELCSPVMNLLRMADSDIPSTGKVYHENLELGKIFQSMTDLSELDFISQNVCTDIQSKWMAQWTRLTIRCMVLDTALILSSTSMTIIHAQKLLQIFCTLCDKVHVAQST